MKSRKDPRHQKRIKIVKELFAYSFTKQDLSEDTKKILVRSDDLDQKIKKAAPTWPIDKLNKIDLAILRQSVFELFNEDTPPKVVIDEAVEIAKEFGSDNSASFINGVLGTILKNIETNENK